VSQVVILPRVLLDQVKTELRAAAWFAALGEPLTDGDRADADAYAKALGLGTLVLGQARDWPEAERVLKAPDWSPTWWDREEAQRRRLLVKAETRYPAPPRKRPINWRWRDWPKMPLRPSKASFVSLPRDAGRWASWALR
jgi:hypothetical protein